MVKPLIGPASPRALKSLLDAYVVGQTRAKRILSVAVWNHYQRILTFKRWNLNNNGAIQDNPWASSIDKAKIPLFKPHPVEDEYPGQTKTVFLDPVEPKQKEELEPSTNIIAPRDRYTLLEDPIELQKGNVLMIGPSGVGKTLIARTLAQIIDVPFSISDCTSFTQTGYVGDDVESCVQRLLSSCNWDIQKAEHGIICLDEVDKIATKSVGGSRRDISGEGVQQSLLKLLEGTVLQITPFKDRRRATERQPTNADGGGGGMSGAGGMPGKGETFTVDTSNMLFILCGAFNGLNKIVSNRVSKGSIGFNAVVQSSSQQSDNQYDTLIDADLVKESEGLYYRPDQFDISSQDNSANQIIPQSSSSPINKSKKNKINVLSLTQPSDFIHYGMVQELLGRVPITAVLDALDEEAMTRVLTEPRNSIIKQYIYMFELSGIELKFTQPALREISRSALKLGTGARALRSVLESLLTDAMFEAPDSSVKYVLVNHSVAARKQPPIYFSKGQQHRFQKLVDQEEEQWRASIEGDNESAASSSKESSEVFESTGYF